MPLDKRRRSRIGTAEDLLRLARSALLVEDEDHAMERDEEAVDGIYKYFKRYGRKKRRRTR